MSETKPEYMTGAGTAGRNIRRITRADVDAALRRLEMRVTLLEVADINMIRAYLQNVEASLRGLEDAIETMAVMAEMEDNEI